VRIEQNSTKVRATATESGTHHPFEADRLICTIPFSALRRVEVQPFFSELKRKAIDQLAYDTITRVVLQCRSRYWEQDGCNGFGISDLEQEIWHPTFDQPGPRGLLVSYMCLSAGQRASAMDDDKRLAFVSDDMNNVHPGLRQYQEGAVTKVWHTDPWVGGATALPSPGQLTSIRRITAELSRYLLVYASATQPPDVFGEASQSLAQLKNQNSCRQSGL
jgi:monoamine oxidase